MVNGIARKLSFSAVILVVGLAGCRSSNPRSTADSIPRSTEPVLQVVVLWSEAVLRQDNLPVAQGFVGKVYLFGADSTQPITTPGKFTIYAYDDTNKSAKNADELSIKPTHRWEIDESQLRNLLRKDAIGWSYSLWLPVGPPEPTSRNFSIIASFTPESGRRVVGESSLVTLPAVDGTSKSVSDGTNANKSIAKGNKSAVKLAGISASE